MKNLKIEGRIILYSKYAYAIADILVYVLYSNLQANKYDIHKGALWGTFLVGVGRP